MSATTCGGGQLTSEFESLAMTQRSQIYNFVTAFEGECRFIIKLREHLKV